MHMHHMLGTSCLNAGEHAGTSTRALTTQQHHCTRFQSSLRERQSPSILVRSYRTGSRTASVLPKMMLHCLRISGAEEAV